eukprot:gene4192-8334_t
MGCSPSKRDEKIAPMEGKNKPNEEKEAKEHTDNQTPKSSTPPQTYTMIVNDRCPLIRVDASTEMKTLFMKGERFHYTLKYGYVSQRGYYPNALNKANQDSYAICENLLGDTNAHLFGIFDGHGEFGDYCSYFAATQIPAHLERELKEHYDGIKTFESLKMEEAYNKAFVEANRALHSSTIDDSLSGTTAITGVVVGDMLYVANVGDSRAIVGREENGKIVYSALSSDQTPYRKDERERIKKRGGKIMTLEQIEGNEPVHENWGAETGDTIDEDGDPPRIWDSSLERPGCAFTRSVGDLVAEQVGVCASPEITTYKLSPRDRYVIIASDGVFEFLTSQAVIDILMKFDDVLKGSKAVISESYRLWLTYDERTDDISMVVMTFSNFAAQVSNRANNIRADSLFNHVVVQESKPMRWMMGKGRVKRRTITENYNVDLIHETFDFEANSTPKSDVEMKRLAEMTASSFMFSKLSQKHKDMLYKVMQRRDVVAGELVIKEGDPGDEMYVVNSGQFTVFKRDENGVTQELLTYTTPGSAFGELSLMYGEPRGASVRAKTDGSLWALGRQAFRAIIMNRRHKGLLSLLRGLPMFRELPYTSLQRLGEMSTEDNHLEGEVIAQQGIEYPWEVVVVLTGEILLTSKDQDVSDSVKTVGTCFAKTEIGTTWISATAVGACCALFIPAAVFQEIVGLTPQQLSMSQVPVQRRPSLHETVKLDRVEDRDEYTLDAPLFAMGDYGYVGNFTNRSGEVHAIKVIGKERAVLAHKEYNMVNERMLLATLQGSCVFVPKVTASYQDERITMLVYDVSFMCDLAAAQQHGISDEAKRLCAACVYSAICGLHNKGIMHRFLNSSSIYVNMSGTPMLGDLRYVKPMDGGKTYTICGDPLYFAPEQIGQKGYDYAVDLWAFGVLLFDLYEDAPPFGDEDTDKTSLFSGISSYKNGDLTDKFNHSPPEARSLISALLQPDGHHRIGYKDPMEVKVASYFAGLDWANLEHTAKGIMGLPVTGDPSIVLNETELQPYASEAFSKF